MTVEKQGKNRLGGVTGRGFLPGQSGNPGGRPKGAVSLKRLLLRALKLKIPDGEANAGKRYADVVTAAWLLRLLEGDMQALKLALAYVDGNPTPFTDDQGDTVILYRLVGAMEAAARADLGGGVKSE